MKKLLEQIIKFGFVGFLCFFIDYGIMVFLTEIVGIPYLISSGISFTVSVIVNYLLSVTFVFETDHQWCGKLQYRTADKERRPYGSCYLLQRRTEHS